MTVRVGVIGAGIMGTDHARLLHRDVPGADVVAIADVDVQRARGLAAEIHDCTATDQAFDLIGADYVDAVVVASSDDTHAAYVSACLEAGKPVLCEKPLAPTAQACMALVDLETRTLGDGPPLVSVGFMRRFDPPYVDLKARLQSGIAGAPLMIHSVGRGVTAPDGSSELSVTGSAIHDLDIIPWLLESPIVEACWLAPRQSPSVLDRQDPQLILVRTADGVLSTVDIFLNAKYGYDVRCEVVCSEETMSIAEPVRTIVDAGLGRTTGYATNWRPRFEDAYRIQDRCWIESLREGTASPLATARDGLAAARVADAVITSMHAGGGFVAVTPGLDG